MEDIVMNTLKITNYKPKDFAELLGVSVKTLQRWDREGILKANRTPTDRRYYTYDQYLQFKGINTESDNRQIVIYARVSTRNQKDDLQNQVTFLRQFCNAKGIIVDQCIEDYGSGLNYNRKKWNQLLEDVMEQKIKTIIVHMKIDLSDLAMIGLKNLVNAVHPSSIDFFTAFEYASLIHTFSGLIGMYSLLSHTLKLLPVINFSPLSYKALL